MKSKRPDHIFQSSISYVSFRDFLCTWKYISMHIYVYKPHKIHTYTQTKYYYCYLKFWQKRSSTCKEGHWEEFNKRIIHESGQVWAEFKNSYKELWSTPELVCFYDFWIFRGKKRKWFLEFGKKTLRRGCPPDAMTFRGI